MNVYKIKWPSIISKVILLLLCCFSLLSPQVFANDISCKLLLTNNDLNASEKIEIALLNHPGFLFFRENKAAKFDLDEFDFDRSYTVIINPNDGTFALGSGLKASLYTKTLNFLRFGIKSVYTGTHLSLQNLVESETGVSLNSDSTFGGSIRFSSSGGIEISGYSSKTPSIESMAAIVNMIKKIFPYAHISATPERLQELRSKHRDTRIYFLQKDDKAIYYNQRLKIWNIK